MICKTAAGKELPVSLIIRGRQYPVLTVFTGLAPGEVFKIFADPRETSRLTEIRDDGTVRIHEGFTRLRSVSPSTAATGEPELMVWLDYEPPAEEEE